MQPLRLFALAVVLATLAGADARLGVIHHHRALKATPENLITLIDNAPMLQNISGVWVGVGDQFHADVWAAYFKENALPECGDPGNFTYKHWGEALPDSLALATNGSTGFGVNGHHSSTYALFDMTYDGEYLRYRADWDPEELNCVRFVPYVDHRNGMVYASAIYKTEWRLVDGKLETKDLSCEATEADTVGCFPQGTDGVVHSVQTTTYRCRSGACAAYGPAVAEQDEE